MKRDDRRNIIRGQTLGRGAYRQDLRSGPREIIRRAVIDHHAVAFHVGYPQDAVRVLGQSHGLLDTLSHRDGEARI